MSVDLTDVLQKVNAGRVACGASALNDIPKGKRSSVSHCPLANAFKGLGQYGEGVKVSADSIAGLPTKKAFQFAQAIGGTVVQHNGVATVQNPGEFAAFVRAFDGGSLGRFDQDAYRW